MKLALSLVEMMLIVQMHSVDGCQSLLHDQCLNNETLCFQGKCILAERFQKPTPCTRNAECRLATPAGWQRLSVGCQRGQCLTLIVANGQQANAPQRCFQHETCTAVIPPYGSMCVRQRCVWAVGTNYGCRRSGRCGFGARCINGTCFEPFGG
ncbi:hypothetical protein M514_00705 [Trichuris suis]|uniref:EB domain-containing protein n=1 Tax=Trichuris suis TaxID=68888 RepID=A0A085MMN3_9BILA|nr:hypothetical protein M513_00705 [Trichuris suis]KFD65110.1 hypothetical protein M514_00705 [Trichuris suis]KHJ42838.1 hypothetical protein D918_07120 [Trichuris suis]